MSFVSARLIRFLGFKWLIALAAIVQSAGLMLLALSRSLPAWLKLPAIAMLYALQSVCNSSSVVVSISATNVCASRTPRRKGAINGIATTAYSVGSAVGPVLGASSFAACLEHASAFTFFVGFAASVGVTYALVGWGMPRKLGATSASSPGGSSTRVFEQYLRAQVAAPAAA